MCNFTNSATGEYRPATGAELLTGSAAQAMTAALHSAGADAALAEEDPAETEAPAPEDDAFSVNRGLARELTGRERSGFAWLAVTAAAGAAVLALIYAKVRKFNRRQK